MLLHDFPEFLCDYHFTLCDVIPPSCIQMRNIILSAFPRNMRLPDPSTPNLKAHAYNINFTLSVVNCSVTAKLISLFSLQIDLLPEIRDSPHILSEVDAALRAKQMKADVDEYLKVIDIVIIFALFKLTQQSRCFYFIFYFFNKNRKCRLFTIGMICWTD